ncbi:MAG TPA: 3-hydroxyacyl-CoA dehydrogenase NAD-binding domain-containing protein [Burkholderiales bacterium]|jgi:3-hydroxyacyl-CoA dehydrogenase/enoyl-CoA hydratase/3-hydroxybutyryl-CoA epimerase|nr:3-hydroxyacyl-CoA dehydrogenase NAD-binding domain-containing protein [Burkholderiales bacterium]
MDRASTASTLTRHWRWEIDRDRLAWLTFDKEGESANTFSREALEELGRALAAIRVENPKGLIVRSGKDNFIAGADVEEFTRFKSPQEALAFVKLGWDVFQELRELPFPTTAMVNGFCMGGGVELALACRYRVALDDPKTRFALPEVMLGIMPAWHGLQWLPKLVGPGAALDMILTGRAIDARRAKRMGLVDQAVPLRILENTARMVTLEAPPQRKLSFMNRLMLARPLRGIVTSQARKQVAKRARREHYPAPYAVLESWRKYDGNPFAASHDPSASVETLVDHPTTKNLIRIFFLQERMKSLARGVAFEARHVHVVGAGVMGGDIAAICAMRGLSVTLQDTAPERIAPAVKRAAELFKRRLRDERRVRDALDLLVPDVAGEGARHADVIIEAIFENLEAKRALFVRLESMAKPDAILASNTSSLRLADIATALKDPSRLVGIHFFNPVPQLQLVEVVSSSNTKPETTNDAAAFVRQIDKLPLPVKDSPGFLVNRVLGPYMQNAFRLLDEGHKPETLDAAMEQFGMPMGPAELADTVGLDICLAAGKALAKTTEVPKILANKVALGHLGKKTGQGIYRYENGKAVKGQPDAFDDGLVQQLIEPYLREAEAVLREGIVADADLVDAGLIFGTGFAPFRGGPIHYLRTRGQAS